MAVPVVGFNLHPWLPDVDLDGGPHHDVREGFDGGGEVEMTAGGVADHQADEPVAGGFGGGLCLSVVGFRPHVRQADLLTLQTRDQVSNLDQK